jgi:acetolactate decarboxylase
MMGLSRGVAVVLMASAIGCSPAQPPGSATPPGDGGTQAGPEVQVWGSLRAVMHEGKTEGNVALESTVPGPHAYAVGALSGLRGEITVLDDDVILSFGEPGGTVRTPARGAQEETATLLVRAVVPSWTSHPIDHAIVANRVDEELETIVKNAGVNSESRIPLIIEASVQSLDWHVLAGLPDGGQSAHDGPRSVGKLSGVTVTLFGFFSRNDQGVFTHMGEHSHLHVVTHGERMTGHVDAMTLEPGAVIRLPAR